MHKIVYKLNAINDTKRRNDSKVTQKLWKCLQTFETDLNLSKKQFIKRLFERNVNQFESERHLKTVIDNALNDRLIAEVLDRKCGQRFVPLLDRSVFFGQTNDWYCFQCHSCDQKWPLIGCKCCFRAFHVHCLQPKSTSSECFQPKMASNELAIECLQPKTTFNELDIDFEDFVCHYCRRHEIYGQSGSRLDQLSAKEVQELCEMFYKRIENTLIDVNVYEVYGLKRSRESDVLLFYYLDLEIIRRKVFEIRNYESFLELEFDLRHFCHNFVVINDETIIKPFVECIDSELKEVNYCVDCYLYSHSVAAGDGRPTDEWFTRVCNPPHRLVYAKYRQYPFWPSKVIESKDDSNECLVQFFETKIFSRAVVPKNKIKDIDDKYKFILNSKQKTFSALLLLKYLQRLRDTDTNFKYEKLMKRLKTLIEKQNNPILRALDINLGENVRKGLKRKNREIDEQMDRELTENNANNCYAIVKNDENNGKENEMKVKFTRIIPSIVSQNRIKDNLNQFIMKLKK